MAVEVRLWSGLRRLTDGAEVVTVEVHNLAAFQNGFRCPTTHLDCHALFAAEVAAPQLCFGGIARAYPLDYLTRPCKNTSSKSRGNAAVEFGGHNLDP